MVRVSSCCLDHHWSLPLLIIIVINWNSTSSTRPYPGFRVLWQRQSAQLCKLGLSDTFNKQLMRIIHDRWVLRDEFWISILYASFRGQCYIHKHRCFATAPTLRHLLHTIMLMVSHSWAQQWHVFPPQSCRQSLQWPCKTGFTERKKTKLEGRLEFYSFILN